MIMNKKEEQIKAVIKTLEPYVIAHEYYFRGLMKIKKRKYARSIRTLARLRVDKPDDEYLSDIYRSYFNRDVVSATVKELASDFQDYLTYFLCNSIYKKHPKNGLFSLLDESNDT